MIKNFKIPEERIGILKSCTRELKEKTNTKIDVEGEGVKIEGEPLDVLKTEEIIKAVGRGFSPEKALELLNDEKILCIINLKDYQHTEKSIKRVKGRLIGTDGKTKRRIEEMSGCMLSIYGKTVSIIADSEKISTIKEAIEMLINGSKHNKVYNYLERCLND